MASASDIHSSEGRPEIGFLGLGPMGTAISRRLLDAGHPLVVWNRTRERAIPLEAAGAVVAASPQEVLDRCATVFVMLADDEATDAVLARGTAEFARIAGTTLVQMGTLSAAYSTTLAGDVRAAGGRYVEAPVSGSRVPAERGELVGLLAGEADDIHRVTPLLETFCRELVVCGPVPAGLHAKFAVNVFLMTMVAGLAEAFHLAERTGVDARMLERIIAAGPMSSTVARLKAHAIVEGDYTVQASIPDVWKNARLVVEAAHEAGAAAPLMEVSERLYGRALELGRGDADMAAVIDAIRDLARPAG